MVCVPHPGFSVPFIAQDHDGKIGRLLKLENEHHQSLKRLDEAESMWRKLVQGTPIESLYSANYAGMFRNPAAKPDAAPHIYNEHIYPVFSQGRCRQNVTGIPENEDLARQHVAVFAEQCLGDLNIIF